MTHFTDGVSSKPISFYIVFLRCSPIKQARLASMNSIKGSGSEPSDDRTMAPEADRALLRVREKLLGMEEGGVQLSEAGQVRFLLLAAMSPENLSQMYIGWQPWV